MVVEAYQMSGGVCDSEGGEPLLIECVGGVFIGSAVSGVVGGG